MSASWSLQDHNAVMVLSGGGCSRINARLWAQQDPCQVVFLEQSQGQRWCWILCTQGPPPGHGPENHSLKHGAFEQTLKSPSQMTTTEQDPHARNVSFPRNP